MSFFGAFFVAITLIAKGVTTGQNILEDKDAKKDARNTGRKTYRDHKGVLHDATTGRAIVYHTNPFNGHRLIQDAYTLNTIRDITAEELRDKRKEIKEQARQRGERYFDSGNLFKTRVRLKHQFAWNDKATLFKINRNNICDKRNYSLDNLYYIPKSKYASYVRVWEQIDKPGQLFVKEYIDDIEVYTSLATGLIIEPEDGMVEKLKERGIKWEEFKKAINDYKTQHEMKWGSIPISKSKGV